MEMDSLLMHSTFNKDKIKNYQIEVNNLYVKKSFSDLAKVSGEVLKTVGGDKWYKESYSLDKIDKVYKRKDLKTVLTYKTQSGNTMQIECRKWELQFDVTDISKF